MGLIPTCPRVKYWVDHYGVAGSEDKRAAKDFCTVETAEVVRIFKAELRAISSGNFNDEQLDKLVGKKRKGQYGSYKEWARMMLLWLVEPTS
jgi:hypothetical protein